MKPSHLIQKSCKTQKEQLEVCYSLIDHFVGSQEAEWAILVTKQGNTNKNKKRCLEMA